MRRHTKRGSGRAVVTAAALALMLTACTHVQRAPARIADGFYPIAEGHTWVFRVDIGEGETVDVITRVVSVKDGRAEIASGATGYAYEIRDDGLYRPSVEAYLIRTPVEEGASWSGAYGGTVAVVATGETVTVPAGTFEDCVRIEETTPDGGQRQIHTFCRGVGPVRLEQWVDGATIAVGELTGWGTATDEA